MNALEYLYLMTDAYIETALWSTSNMNDDSGRMLDDNYGREDMAGTAIEECSNDCDDFIHGNWLDLAGIEPKQAGQDFWLTRNGHGVGFWDRGLGELGKRLSHAARVCGGVNLFVENGEIYIA